MKTMFFYRAVLLLWTALFFSCESAVKENYNLCAPSVPEQWLQTLGTPAWRFEWLDRNGTIRYAETSQESYNAVILAECASFALAYPFWTAHNIPAGILKPAGALFPFDSKGGNLILSWQGGIDASFYRALAMQKNQKRLPQNFDWLRFRALWSEKKLGADVLSDGWLAAWDAIAEKTAASGFNSRNIKPRESENLIITLPADGPWIGASPFAKPIEGILGGKAAFRSYDNAETYFCPSGQLRIASKIFVWIPSH